MIIMDAINQDILNQLQEYAQKYFAAIVDANTVGGECELKEGKYSAKDMMDHSYKSVFGRAYNLPKDTTYDETITLESGTFKCRFPYRRIFAVLADWETMCKAGKQKAIFEIGEVEEKSAKVLINDKTILGAFKTKTMKLQRIGGNWWGQPKEIQKGSTTGYYELNGVMFAPGKTFWGKVRDESNKRFTEKFDDAEITKMLISYLAASNNADTSYFAEVARLAGIDTETEEAKTIADTAREEKRKREEERQREEAEERERKRIREEEYRKSIEEEERQAAESLAKAKENFISGKMVSRNDFERIAESVGYAINIRTLGTLRKRIAWIKIKDVDNVTVYGTKKRAGLDGTFEVIREVYALVKTQSEESTKQATEPPQISTETAETVNMSAEGENAEKTMEIKPMCETTCDERPTLDDHDYYTWLWMRDYESEEFPELASENRYLSEGWMIYLDNQHRDWRTDMTPQSPETPQAFNYATMPEKCDTEPRNKSKQAARILHPGYHPDRLARTIHAVIVPRKMNCSTECHIYGITTPPGLLPPIRGDCTSRTNTV